MSTITWLGRIAAMLETQAVDNALNKEAADPQRSSLRIGGIEGNVRGAARVSDGNLSMGRTPRPRTSYPAAIQSVPRRANQSFGSAIYGRPTTGDYLKNPLKNLVSGGGYAKEQGMRRFYDMYNPLKGPKPAAGNSTRKAIAPMENNPMGGYSFWKKGSDPNAATRNVIQNKTKGAR